MDNRSNGEGPGNSRGNGLNGDMDQNAGWPQRPTWPRPEISRPRLDPPQQAGRLNASPAQSAGRQGYSPASKAPGTPDPRQGEGETKETRLLPTVEPSRFDRNQGARTAPTSPPRSSKAQPPPAQPRQPYTPSAPPPVQGPQGRKSGGWQYERDEQPEYEENESYAPARDYRPLPQAKNRAVNVNTNRSYLAVDVEGVKKRRGGWILWTLGGILAIAVIAVVAFSLAWQGQYAGKIYSGVSVLGVNLGGKTPDEAKSILNDKVQAFISQPVVLTWRGKEWRPSADQIGVTIDVDGTVNQAFQVGRDADIVANASQQWTAAQQGYMVPITLQLSEPALQSYLSTIAANEIDETLFDGDVRLNGTQIVAMPGKEGRSLRTYDAITMVREAMRDTVAKLEQGTAKPASVELPVDVLQPTVSAQEVSYVQGLLAVRISSPITATAPGKTFSLSPDALVSLTTIERNPDRSAQRHIELGWKENELKTLADKWASESSRSSQNARFAWNNGSISVLSESADGFQIDATTVISSVKEATGTSDKRQYALPGKVITPTVSSKDIGALGIKELMGTGTSTFKGSSPERATNIKVAANLLNGAVVPPGGTFSFLQTMGGIDEAHGFVPGYVIAAERTQLGVGGGVCQVSTTAFRAAFWSGMQITERNQHSYRVGWYEANGEPVGFDAAVFDPGVDLKFVNITSSYMLVEAVTTSDTLVINFYGTKIPGQVKLEGPVISNRQPAPPDVYEVDTRLPAGSKKQVETARAGLDTVITRRIVTPGQADKVDQFYSAYKPWPNWFIVASASQIPGGAKVASQPTPNP